MENESYWQHTITLPKYPQINKNCNYDVVIVGGGISGVSLAYRLNNSNLKVALFESDTLGSKTTGHTTAKVTYLHGAVYADIYQVYGRSKAKQYLESNYEAYQDIKKIIEMEQIECDFKENIAYVGASDTTNAKKLDCQIRLFKSWGFEVLENRLKNCQISMGLKQQAIFHPLKYLKGLLAQCKHIDIYEHSLVTGSMHQDGLVCLEVNGFKVQARQVVWMTRYPPNLQHGYFFRIIQEKEHVIFQEGQSNGNSILDLSTNYSKRYLDEQHILMIKRIDDLNQVYWYAQDGKPLRKIPYIGKMNEQEYAAYAYNKWGMTLSHVASKLIYDLIINDESKYASLYQPSYGNYLKSGADMLKLVKNNYHGMIKNRLVSSKKLKLKKQQGKVIRHQGRLLAVYKDAQERIFYFSPYCPHLKCVVQYNEIDNTWNCPCHGSIFDCHGKLVSGPATKDLKQY